MLGGHSIPELLKHMQDRWLLSPHGALCPQQWVSGLQPHCGASSALIWLLLWASSQEFQRRESRSRASRGTVPPRTGNPALLRSSWKEKGKFTWHRAKSYWWIRRTSHYTGVIIQTSLSPDPRLLWNMRPSGEAHGIEKRVGSRPYFQLSNI